MRFLLIALFVIGASTPATADEAATTRHLLAGVRAFREARYEEALVELRIVQRAPDAPADLAFYLGPTLYKLGRHADALDVFLASTAPRDPLTDLYLGQTYYQLHLYRKARAVFVALRARSLGPVLDESARRYVTAIDGVYATPPPATAIDALIDQGRAFAKAGRHLVALELYDEARQVEALAVERHRRGELLAALGAEANAARRPQAAIAALAPEATASPEITWQLARAYLLAAQPAQAAPLLDALVRAGGPHADDARALQPAPPAAPVPAP